MHTPDHYCEARLVVLLHILYTKVVFLVEMVYSCKILVWPMDLFNIAPDKWFWYTTSII